MSLVATESQYKILERINPLQTTLIEQSIVSSRVALLLRSAEIKLLFSRLFFKTFPVLRIVKETVALIASFVLFFFGLWSFLLSSRHFLVGSWI